jgi:microcystin-dependent protein
MSVSSTNPGTTFGVGTWTAWGAGRVPVGVAGSGTFNTVEKTGGAETHTLSTAEMPTHNHGAGSLAAPIYTTTGGAVTVPNIYTPLTSNYTESANELHNGLNAACVGSTANAGSGSAHNNLQPYITCYMWKRTE